MTKALLAILPPLSIIIIGVVGIVLTYPSYLGVVFLAVAVFGYIDSIGRYSDYRRNIVDYLSHASPSGKIFLADFYGRSFCGRWMMSVIDPMLWRYYWTVGYRPWHILPDGFPAILLNPRFWKTLVKGHRK